MFLIIIHSILVEIKTFSLLNKTVTQIGKITYKNRLLYPCLNSSKINEYEIIDILLHNKLYTYMFKS